MGIDYLQLNWFFQTPFSGQLALDLALKDWFSLSTERRKHNDVYPEFQTKFTAAQLSHDYFYGRQMVKEWHIKLYNF